LPSFFFGAANAGVEMTGTDSQSTFAMASGGGVDVVFNKNLAWRFAQIDYLMTNFTGTNVGSSGRQNNLRLGSGLVLRWGFPSTPAPAANRPPVAACSVSPASVFAGASDVVAFHVNASDPDNDPLTYAYTATGGTIEGTGADARWSPSGLAAGTYTATAKVDDGKGGTASCSADLKVEPEAESESGHFLHNGPQPDYAGRADGNYIHGERSGWRSTDIQLQRGRRPGDGRRAEGDVRFDRLAARKLSREMRRE